MDRNMKLAIGFRGDLDITAQAVPLQEGYLKIGGIVDASADKGLKFGVVVSATPADENSFKAGLVSGDVIRGICVFDDAIAQNAPAHPDRYLASMPCAALNHGFMWLTGWKKTATGAADPAIGSKVIFKNTDGTIEFVPAATAVPSGWTQLEGASVRAIDPDNGALIYLD